MADTGFSNGEQGKACQDAGITAIVPRPTIVNPKDAEHFSRDTFSYDEASDTWSCPAEQTLSRYKSSQTEQTHYYRTSACTGCTRKPRCTKADRRSISRGFYEADKEAMHQRAMSDPALMKRRRELAEHPSAPSNGCSAILVFCCAASKEPDPSLHLPSSPSTSSEPSKSSAHKPYCTRSNLNAHEHDQTYLRTAISQKLRNQIT